eukprot:TRINITY_DN2143_c1_g1_i2.p2 TRINITY_DN2143_c1_g1~~TRINITY_DN2143_c1_g1_i2.p2  ORF type:complete len:234 (+),score=37.79 TRINITY_DN2143_c1_g1_i2:799-1500(+)
MRHAAACTNGRSAPEQGLMLAGDAVTDGRRAPLARMVPRAAGSTCAAVRWWLSAPQGESAAPVLAPAPGSASRSRALTGALSMESGAHSVRGAVCCGHYARADTPPARHVHPPDTSRSACAPPHASTPRPCAQHRRHTPPPASTERIHHPLSALHHRHNMRGGALLLALRAASGACAAAAASDAAASTSPPAEGALPSMRTACASSRVVQQRRRRGRALRAAAAPLAASDSLT